jgi:hypothetical protein
VLRVSVQIVHGAFSRSIPASIEHTVLIAEWHNGCFIQRQENKTMRTKTNCKAGQDKIATNHNETLVRDNGKNLKVKTALRAGKKAAS